MIGSPAVSAQYGADAEMKYLHLVRHVNDYVEEGRTASRWVELQHLEDLAVHAMTSALLKFVDIISDPISRPRSCMNYKENSARAKGIKLGCKPCHPASYKHIVGRL